MTPWRDDPLLAGRFHPEYPDDLQVIVHDGEPRRTQRGPEACWVRVEAVHGTLRTATGPENASPPLTPAQVRWSERPVYRATLLNVPAQLTSVAQGGAVLFVCSPGLPHPLAVTEAYLQERPRWVFQPCSKCGADQGFDPPSVMARTRFPDIPADASPVAFTAFCGCGGTMVLRLIEEAAPEPKKPWWKLWG